MSMSIGDWLGVCVLVAFVSVCVGMFIGAYHAESVPQGAGMVAFQDGRFVDFDSDNGDVQYVKLNQPLSIEALNGEVPIPGTNHMYVRYALTTKEAEILGQEFGKYLANNFLVEETTSPVLGFKSSGYRTALPAGVDPTHIMLVQKG